MKKGVVLVILLLALALATPLQAEPSGLVLIASTIGPIDAGIVGALESAFEAETNIRVRHVGAGTGAALDTAKQGGIDLALVHAKSLEEKFVAEGFGTERIDFMYNDFVILGPASDPAGVKATTRATEALTRISEGQALFVSRGDKSGTHVAEMELWQKAGITPKGAWYRVYEKGAEGNVPTLRFADQNKAYTVIDRATYLTVKGQIALSVLLEKDEALINFISLVPVNPKKFPRVNYEDTMTFVTWLTSPDKGQLLIRDFGKDKYGDPLFFPNSKEWRDSRDQKK
jgi:tungstate transport system substrate-binding protein